MADVFKVSNGPRSKEVHVKESGMDKGSSDGLKAFSKNKKTLQKIELKCLQMKEMMKNEKRYSVLSENDIENRILAFRNMLMIKEGISENQSMDKIEKSSKDSEESKKIKRSHSSPSDSGKQRKEKKKKLSSRKLNSSNRKNKSKRHQEPDHNNGKRSESCDRNEEKSIGKHIEQKQVGTASPALSHRSKASEKSKKSKASSQRSNHRHNSFASDRSSCEQSLLKSPATGVPRKPASHSAHQHSPNIDRRRSRGRSRERHSDRRSDSHRSTSHRRSRASTRSHSPSHSRSRSRSPSIRRRKGSPSHLDRRRITRSRLNSGGSSKYSHHSRSRSPRYRSEHKSLRRRSRSPQQSNSRQRYHRS